MIVIPSQRIVFVHIPRTGGLSLVDAVYASVYDTVHLGGRLWEHARASQSQQILGGHWRVLAVIRNPWEIYESHYRFCLKYRERSPDLDQMANLPFDQYIRTAHDRDLINGPLGFVQHYADLPGAHVFRMEDQPWETISTMLHATLIMPHVNGAPGEQLVWDDENIERVRERCAYDIEHFGYTFNGMRSSEKEQSCESS